MRRYICQSSRKSWVIHARKCNVYAGIFSDNNVSPNQQSHLFGLRRSCRELVYADVSIRIEMSLCALRDVRHSQEDQKCCQLTVKQTRLRVGRSAYAAIAILGRIFGKITTIFYTKIDSCIHIYILPLSTLFLAR